MTAFGLMALWVRGNRVAVESAESAEQNGCSVSDNVMFLYD